MPRTNNNEVQGLEEVQEELKNFQKSDGNGWILFGYKEGTKNVLERRSQGVEFEEFRGALNSEECLYGYLKYDHKVELAKTVKFAFVDWTPPGLKPMFKALVSTHKGQINDSFKPAHVTFQWKETDDISEQDIVDKIGFSSGTKSHITTKAAMAQEGGSIALASPRSVASPSKGQALVNEDIKENRTLKFEDEDALRAAIKAVRNDSDPTNWCLCSYVEGNIDTLTLVSTGDSGLEGMLAALDESRVWYGFFRVTEQYDKTTAVKFGFFKLLYPTIKALWKAKLSTHRGFVVDVFQPYHAEFLGDSPKDLSVEGIMDKISKGSGTKNNVVGSDKLEAEKKRKADYEAKRAAINKDGPSVVTEATKISFEDQEAFKAAIAAVRSDADATTWMVATLENKNTLKVAASGDGEPVESAKAALPVDHIAFSLIRTTDRFDESVTVKFVYIKWKPDSISPTEKTLFTTMKGAIDPLFEPYHTDLTATELSQITTDIIKDKVQAAAGTKVNEVVKTE